MYEGINIHLKSCLMFNVLFVIRRMVFGCLAVYLGDYPFLQIHVFIATSVGTLGYLMSVKPF